MPEVEAPLPTVKPPAEQHTNARLSKELIAGLVLVLIAILALWASAPLDMGTLRSVGPGAMPRGVALLVLAFGLVFSGAALFRGGEALGRWPLRGPVFICLGIVAFALTIRTIGLAAAGPVVVLVSGAASPDTRPVELAIFAAVMTAFCVGLFRFALGLPIPVLIIPGLFYL